MGPGPHRPGPALSVDDRSPVDNRPRTRAGADRRGGQPEIQTGQAADAAELEEEPAPAFVAPESDEPDEPDPDPELELESDDEDDDPALSLDEVDDVDEPADPEASAVAVTSFGRSLAASDVRALRLSVL